MDLKAEFEQIVTANQDWLYRYILSMVKNKQTAEDLVQEVFISAYRSWDCYEERGKLRNWLRIIARNMAVRHLQAEDRQMVSIYADLGSADDDLYILDTLAGAESPERDAFDRELLQQILAAINELPDHQRQVVYYRYIQDFSVNMTAKITNQPVGSVKSKSYYGLAKVKNRIAQYLVEGDYIMSCRESYPFYYQYAKGKIAIEDRVKVERHIAVCDDCKRIVSSLASLIPHIAPAQEDEKRHILISIPLQNGQTLTYSEFRVPMHGFYEQANSILTQTAGRIPEGENWFSWGYDSNMELLGEFDNEGNKIEYESYPYPHNPSSTRVVYKCMKKVYPLHTIASVFLENRSWVRSTLEAPNLMIGELSNTLDDHAKSGLYLALPGNAENIRIKKGSGVIDAGHYKFAYSDRYVTEDETIKLECSYLI